MNRKLDAVVILHFDDRGEQQYYAAGDGVAFFIVDDRAPGDRVYEWLKRDSSETISTILGNDPIGSSQDSRHEAIKNLIESRLDGRPQFKIVETIDE